MKIHIAKTPLRQLLKWTQRTMLVAAVSMLGYSGYVLADTWSFQRAELREFDREMAGRRASATIVYTPPRAAAGELIGHMSIQRLGLSVVVMEGTSSATLRHAAGHIVGTAMPGNVGNVGISGHRDTLFRPLRNIRHNDIIELTTLQGEYRFRVVSTQLVSPQDIVVLNSSGGQVLTLVTCYPFYYVGSAPRRFIVRAERVI